MTKEPHEKPRSAPGQQQTPPEQPQMLLEPPQTQRPVPEFPQVQVDPELMNSLTSSGEPRAARREDDASARESH
jgi:hypothetical protein